MAENMASVGCKVPEEKKQKLDDLAWGRSTPNDDVTISSILRDLIDQEIEGSEEELERIRERLAEIESDGDEQNTALEA